MKYESEIKLEDNVPIPEPEKARVPDRKPKYPIKTMKIGQSFFVPGLKYPNNIYRAAKLEGRTLTARLIKVRGQFGFRFWRVS